jgi:Zn-dependent peptidase ImmA (M78 family)
MNHTANADMLILAREIRGLTQKQLSDATGIDQGRISRYEGGLKAIPEDELQILAETLSFPLPFFLSDGKRLGVEAGELFHRKRQTVSMSEQKRIDGLINLYRLGMETLLNAVEFEAPYSIPQYKLNKSNGNAEQIAGMVRAAWKMPSGPITNLIARLEAASCMVFRVDFGTDKIDEAVQWIKPLPPIILVNSRSPGDRLRFSLAHALGHLVMHYNDVPYIEMEAEADQFASAFLMPAEDIRMELPPVTIDHMLQLKPSWKVSMQALIRRARDIGEINERRYTSLFEMLSRAGYRKKEPQPIQAENPEQVKNLLALYKTELGYSDAELASLVNLQPNDFRAWYYPESNYLSVIPKRKTSSA